ncbi:hypothetical protein [Actinomadura terrae]|uniref:hypothetical protein n=1 Tax=Actinomadura terrae TaxID=604353 RepID=UPI001FA6B09C|nr:hypothetical protein [Actinomadura terrae]
MVTGEQYVASMTHSLSMVKTRPTKVRQRPALFLASGLAAALLTAGVAGTTSANAAEKTGETATVQVTVIGTSGTIFSGSVTTEAHDLTTAAGGTHKCDGTNNGQNPQPGPTVTGALDDAATGNGFTWDGPWYSFFDDYQVKRIATESNTNQVYWQYWLNGQHILIGGCQQQVETGDQITWKLVPESTH